MSLTAEAIKAAQAQIDCNDRCATMGLNKGPCNCGVETARDAMEELLPAIASLAALVKERDELRALVESLAWSTRNAAENAYCQLCGNSPEVDRWKDQTQHLPTCPVLSGRAGNAT
jgi:hypothetical protein